MKECISIQITSEPSPRRRILGLVLAICSLILSRLWFPQDQTVFWCALPACAVFLAVGFFRFHAHSHEAASFLNILWGILFLILITATHLPTYQIIDKLGRITLNLLCAFFVTACFLAVTASWRASILLSAAAVSLLFSANAMVYAFRGKELGIHDILSVRTALSVAHQYKFQATKRVLALSLVFSLGLFSLTAIPGMPRLCMGRLRLRITALFAALAALAAVHLGAERLSIKTWDNEGTRVNGYLLNFYMGIRDAKVDMPEHYSPEALQNYTPGYHPEASNVEMPNIIVIMDEAFSDLRVFPGELTTNQPVMPFLDSLTENTVKGYALSSVIGGNTANSEFEFLTGHSLAFLPKNSVPYQQYIFNDVCSLAWVLESQGYTTFATHPYLAAGWSRPTVYPLLGLKESTFIEDYPNQNIVRYLISDREMFEYVLDYLNARDTDQPVFLMGITMQNHGGYTYEAPNFTETVRLEGFRNSYPQADQYLSLIHETDRAVEYLLTQLQDYPQKTVVLFFGDHQPKLEAGLYEELNGGPLDSLDEQMQQYMVPFFIWANYELEPDYIPCTSISYLSRYLLEYAGLELPAYYRALADIENTIPAINAAGYYSNEKGRFAAFEEATGKEAQMLELYRMLQYNNLFDRDNRDYEFFSQFLSQQNG